MRDLISSIVDIPLFSIRGVLDDLQASLTFDNAVALYWVFEL